MHSQGRTVADWQGLNGLKLRGYVRQIQRTQCTSKPLVQLSVIAITDSCCGRFFVLNIGQNKMGDCHNQQVGVIAPTGATSSASEQAARVCNAAHGREVSQKESQE